MQTLEYSIVCLVKTQVKYHNHTERFLVTQTLMMILDGDGFGDEIIDLGLNDGRADAFVPPNRLNEFSEYQFSVDNLEAIYWICN